MTYTELVPKTAAFIFSEVYDSMRLWWVAPKAVAAMRALNLVGVLGNQANVDELRRLLNEIESIDFYNIAEDQSLRYHSGEFCLSRYRYGGDYAF